MLAALAAAPNGSAAPAAGAPDFVEAPSIAVHCVDMCNDGLQNNGETGVDCGGPCAACEELHLEELAAKNEELAKRLAALRLKIAAEQKAKEEQEQENKVAKVTVSFMIVAGAGIVLGGPVIYYLRRGKGMSGGIGAPSVGPEGGKRGRSSAV